MLTSRSSLLIAAALASLAFAPPAASVERAVNGARIQTGRAILPVRNAFGGASAGRGARRAGPGWSNRHAQRVAAKKRNVVGHRARSRGRA